MVADWMKPGAIAAVKIAEVQPNGWVGCQVITDSPGAVRPNEFFIHSSALSPVPEVMTREQADVIAAAKAWKPGFGGLICLSSAVAALRRAESEPDPVATLREAARKAEFTLRQQGAIVTADMLADAISSSEVFP